MDPLKEKKPGQNLDVEGPLYAEREMEHLSQSVGVPEDLRPTLGVVNGQPDRNACTGGKYPPQVMSDGIPPDVTPEQQNPRADHPIDSPALQQFAKPGNRF